MRTGANTSFPGNFIFTLILLGLSACLLPCEGRGREKSFSSDTSSVVPALDYGLHIESYPAAQDLFTGLTLEEGRPIPTKGKVLRMDFDLYNRPENVFGCIFRIITEAGENVDLMYTADLQGERQPLLVTGEEVHALSSPIPMGEWIHVSIALSPLTGQVDLEYGQAKLSIRDAGTKGAQSFRISFGLCPFPGYQLADVASVDVRDICISRGGKPLRRWECARHDGDICYDLIGGVAAIGTNPHWVLDKYVSWHPVFSHSFSRLPSVTFDDWEKFYFSFGDDPILVYNTTTSQLSEIPVRGGHNPANFPNQLFYVGGGHDWLTAYNLDEGLFSRFDFNSLRWDNENTPSGEHDYWNNTNSWEPRLHAMYSFGGYGHYHYRNELMVNFLDDPSRSYRSSLEDITPRYGMTSYIVDSLLYVFGGRGNLSGKQELSPKNYYDLYSVNTRTLDVNLLWDMKESPWGDFMSGENFVYNWENGDFYLLSNLDGHTLLRLRPEKGGLEKMSFPIPPKGSAQYRYTNIWHSYSKGKIYALVLGSQVDDHTDVDIYEIDYPPVPVSMVQQAGHDPGKKFNWDALWLWLMRILGTLAFLFLLWDFLWRRVFRKDTLPVPVMSRKSFSRSASLEEETVVEDKYYDFSVSSVRLFGAFKAMDKDGCDITGQFTPMVSELMMLLILATGKSGGIASQKINHLLWSYKPDSTANNNRNVCMSKLRPLLEKIGVSATVGADKLWYVNFPEGTICDYLEAMRLFSQGSTSEEDVDRLLELLLHGQMLPAMESEWLDEYRSYFSNLTIDFLCKQLRREDLSDAALLRAANTIFQHDFLNEDALRAKVRILYRQNKPGLAKDVYDSFCKEYVKSLGIDYEIPIKDLLKA